jgi:hypothetical protein
MKSKLDQSVVVAVWLTLGKHMPPLVGLLVTPTSLSSEPEHASKSYLIADIQGVTGGTDQTSGGCSLCYSIPI